MPVSGGITMARAAGLIPQDVVDERYGMTVDEWLVDRRVIQGIEEYGDYRCPDENGPKCLFDADDLDNGTDGTGAPSDEPLRLTLETDVGVSALRLPYSATTGTHGFRLPTPSQPGDQNSLALNQIAYYFMSGGQDMSDDICMSDFSCDWLPELDVNTAPEDTSDTTDTGTGE